MPAGGMLRIYMKLWQSPWQTASILTEKLGGRVHRGGPSGSRWQGGIKAWSRVSSSEQSKSNKGGIYCWDGKSVRWICSKQRQHKAGYRGVGGEVGRKGTWVGAWEPESWIAWVLVHVLLNPSLLFSNSALCHRAALYTLRSQTSLLIGFQLGLADRWTWWEAGGREEKESHWLCLLCCSSFP